MDNTIILYLKKLYTNIKINIYNFEDKNITELLIEDYNMHDLYLELLINKDLILSNFKLYPNLLDVVIIYKNIKKHINFINNINKIGINIYDDYYLIDECDNNKIIKINCEMTSLIFINIIKLLTENYILDDNLEMYIINNIDIIVIIFKNNDIITTSKILLNLNYINFKKIIEIKKYLYKILFDVELDNNYYLLNPSNMIELFVLIIISKINCNELTDKIIDILLFDYKLDNYNILYVKTILKIIDILNNNNIQLNIKIGYILKKYKHLDINILIFAFKIYNILNINIIKINIEKIINIINDNQINEFFLNKNLDIPKYNNCIIEYQNIEAHIYGNLYNTESYNINDINILFDFFLKLLRK